MMKAEAYYDNYPGLCCWDRDEAKKTLARREAGAILRVRRIHEYVERT